MKILLSAYACEPGKGSEQEVGLQIMLTAAQRHDVWVLTRQNSVSLLEEFLAQHPLRDRIRLYGIDLNGPILRREAVWPARPAHLLRRVATSGIRACPRSDRSIHFDVVHHATFATYWTRAGVSQLGKPFVWGPVGGGVRTPVPTTQLGAAGLRRRRFSAKRFVALRFDERAIGRRCELPQSAWHRTRARHDG